MGDVDYQPEQEMFVSSADRMEREKQLRKDVAKNLLPFSVPYLDRVLGGILPTDLILIGAKTGAGKSELAVTISKNVAALGKRVHLFALEAEDCEVERRMKYQQIANLYRKAGGKKYINYQDWYLGRYRFLDKYDAEAEKNIVVPETLYTYYRDNKFDIMKLQRMFRSLDGKTDLVVLDHLQYIDFDGDAENKAVAEIVKTIKDMSQLQRVPVIMIAHLRKIGKQERTLVPAIEDFHGTSNISKIATRIVVMAPGGLDEAKRPITYVQAAKNRLAGERTRVLAKMTFDPATNSYLEEFAMGMLSADEKQFIQFNYKEETPKWLEPVEE